MRKSVICGLLAAAAIAATPLVAANVQPGNAQPGKGKMMSRTEARTEVAGDTAKMFARLDANKDGFVTDAEMQALQAKSLEKRQAKMEQRAAQYDPAKAFARLDTNKDGKLTKAEVDAVKAARAQAKGKPGNNADRLFARADTNKDGAITLAEMQALPKPQFTKAAMPKSGFKGHMLASADLNKDGKVSLAELQQSALQRFDRADANRDGKVTPDERKVLRQAMRAQPKT